jgi:hypothetical protein
MLMEKAERLPATLKNLDFKDFNQVIWFLQAVNEVGYAGVDLILEMEEIFISHGFYPVMMNGTGAYDPNDERSFALYIIGRALATNHDIIHPLAREWRERFSKIQPQPL